MKATVMNGGLAIILVANAAGSYLRSSPDHWAQFEMLWYGLSTLILIALSLGRSAPSVGNSSVALVLICALSFYYPVAFSANVDEAASLLLVNMRIGLQILSDATLFCLGRSFAILPAYRQLVVAGPYSIVRHPAYALYMLADVLFVLSSPSWWNAVIAVAGASAFVFRAVAEERVLATDAGYREYAAHVRWRFVPFVV